MLKKLSKYKILLKEHYLLFLFLLFYFLTNAYKIIIYKTPFYNWDESIYAQVGREMIAQKSVLTPLWQGSPWLDKPPLAPLMYGIVQTLTPFLEPEISTRIFTLFISCLILLFIYFLYLRLTKDTIVSTLTVIVTAFVPAFLQRSQVLNVDIFLVLGWLGYLLFFKHFRVSLIFLGVAVYSKSLVGFYPPVLYILFFLYQLLTKKITRTDFKKNIRKIILQVSIISLWYLYMFARFGGQFWQSHFLDSHFKRVTASIESHFGARTFYIDLIRSEFGPFIYLSILGIVFVFIDYLKKKDIKFLFHSLFFVPWFLFLNLTKTKIAWYIYPVIHQFAFLSVYFLRNTKKIPAVYYATALFLVGYIFFQNFGANQFFNTQYSSKDENYEMALYANGKCDRLAYLVDPESRKTHDTLQNLNLLITSSEWWGSHPRIVYYSGAKVDFIYDKSAFEMMLTKASSGNCLAYYKNDSLEEYNETDYYVLKSFSDLILIKKR